MPEERIKQRRRREKEKVKALLIYEGCQVTDVNNKIIDLSASIIPFFARKIRIALDKIEPEDYKIIRTYRVLSNERREIWCRENGMGKFKKVEVKDSETAVIYDPCQG